MIQQFNADERGVSEVVGAILVFALAIMLLTIMQTQAVPNQNSEVEFQHSLEVQSDLIQFHQIASSVAAGGSDRSVSFNMGTSYPSRLLFFNPPRVQGQLETSDPDTVTINNVEASNAEVNDYVTDNQSGRLDLQTRRMEYRVDYNEFTNDPTTRYEYGVLYNEYEDGRVIENDGNIIDGTTINLLFLAGDFTASGTTEDSLDVQAVSAPARSVTITSPNSNPISLVLPTQLDAQEWDDLYNTPTNNVQGVSSGPTTDTVEITLDPTKDYTLRMSEIGLESGVATNNPEYIVPVKPGVTSAAIGQTAVVEYEVRDQFNNPVIGADVAVPDGSGGFTTKTTDDSGRVTAPVSTNQDTDFTAFLVDSASLCPTSPGSGNPSHCQAEYKVHVPMLNINPASGVVVEKSRTGDLLANGVTTGLTADNVTGVTFKNTDPKEDASIVRFRINHYSPAPNSHSPVLMEGPGGDKVKNIEIGGAFKTQSNSNLSEVEAIPAGEEKQFLFEFDDTTAEGHYFVMTVVFDTGERGLYFISPEGTASGSPSPSPSPTTLSP